MLYTLLVRYYIRLYTLLIRLYTRSINSLRSFSYSNQDLNNRNYAISLCDLKRSEKSLNPKGIYRTIHTRLLHVINVISVTHKFLLVKYLNFRQFYEL